MRVLLTGGCGFVGHHIFEGLLKETDHEVVVLDALTYAGNLNRLYDIQFWQTNHYEKLLDSDYAERFQFIGHDLKFPISETTHKMIGDIDYVIHLAAESHVENSLKDPLPFAYNVVATTNLLEYLRKNQFGLKKYIGFNTDEVFGPAPKNVFYKEEDKFYPSNPYSGSKAGQWCMEYAFYKSFRMPIVMVHSMNIYAERQHPEKFIPKTVKAILEGKPATIHGKPDTGEISSRCWIHARAVGTALEFLLERGVMGETYNVVGEERSVLDLANRACNVIKNRDLKDEEIEWIDFHTTRPGHDLRYALSGEKMDKLGWKPKFTFEQSFDKTVNWMIQPENKKWLNL